MSFGSFAGSDYENNDHGTVMHKKRLACSKQHHHSPLFTNKPTMKFSTIAVLLLAAANSAHAQDDEVATKEKEIAAEIQMSAVNLEKAEAALEEKQAGIRGSATPALLGAPEVETDEEDNDEVEYMNGTPLKPKCSGEGCPRKYAAYKKALHDYDIEQFKDYDPDPVKYINGIPQKEKCDVTMGDEHEKKKCATRHREFERAEMKYERANFPRDGRGSGKPEGAGGQGGYKGQGGRGGNGGK
jgi:hypothetical protein